MRTLAAARGVWARARFLLSLRRFVAPTLSVAAAQAQVSERLARRGELFLATVREAVFEQPRSPYRNLLARAGVDLPRLTGWVADRGVEGALEELCRRDVVITHEEWKAINAGRPVDPQRFPPRCSFDNPLAGASLAVRSSGSRSAPTRLLVDHAAARELAVHRLLRLAAFGGLARHHVVYMPGLPSFGGASVVLSGNLTGEPVARWFTPLDPTRLPRLNRFQDLAFSGALRLAGGCAPLPRHVPPGEAVTVARWIAARRAAGEACTLLGYASTVVRVCLAATDASVDISDTLCFLVGEPTTGAKVAAVRGAACIPVSSYSIAEVGHLANACPESDGPDDMHLFTDAFAVITRRRRIPGFEREVRPFLVTSLGRGAAKVLLNVEVDDYGELSARPCGCLWGRLGLTTRVRGVRSFVKLTASGVSLAGTDLVRVIEEELPARFGGRAVDYQLVEEEDDLGRTVLTLLVGPEVGAVDESEVVGFFRRRLADEGALTRFFGEVLGAANAVRVRRAAPVPTAGGKLLPFHTLR